MDVAGSTRNPRVLRFARTIQRDKMNPLALRDAGTAASPWAIVRVPGRVSGRVYGEFNRSVWSESATFGS